ncbi:hypothetical protein CK203_098030 [Vitis vinifera]|uniref:Uncharacterized protein n=1 Tax=Vitis vinifera TaxID=29760 RepID=A0A438CKS8_VITVI|nr:hypothetical protein CK203_098030 [Vitis vinifera]
MFNNPSLLIQPQPPYLRAIVPQPPKLYVQRLVKEFTLLGMTLTSAFEKLRDAEALVKLTQVHHFATIQFRALFSLTMVIVKVTFVLSSPVLV